jgi:uncharacterized protein (DUF2384 family)
MYRITQALAALRELKADCDDLPAKQVERINGIIMDLKALQSELASIPDPVADRIRTALNRLSKEEERL